MPVGRIFQCVRCHFTVVTFGDDTMYRWPDGDLHNCDETQLFWIEAVATDALNGDIEAAHLLPEAIDAWLTR